MTYESTHTPEEIPPAESSEPAPVTPKPTSEPAEPKSATLRFLPLLLGGLVGLVIVAVVLVVAIRSLFRADETTGIPLEVTRVSVSPLPSPVGPSSSPVIAEVGDTQLSLPAPVALEAGGSTFSVQATTMAGDGTWEVTSEPGTATWVYGTVINYLLGLPSLPENQELVQALQSEDPIILRLSNGTRLTFRVADHRGLTPEDLTPFSQASPGLTLVVRGDGPPWSGVTANFETAIELTPPAEGVVAQVGQAVQVGDARVTVQQGAIQTGQGNPEAGTAIYGVEFLVENNSGAPLDPGDFLMLLMDGLENRYLPSSAAMEGLLSNPIPPGQEVEGMALYVVPEMLVGPELTWVFSPAVGSELRARFAIPFTPESTAPSVSAFEVDVFDAFIGEDGQVLHILADIYNDGDTAITVTVDDVSLSSSAGEMGLNMAAPQLPWTVPAEDFREVELMFERPDASSAVLAILGYSFEISGLP